MRHFHTNLRDLPVRSKGLLLIAFIWFIIGLGVMVNPSPTVDSAFHSYLPDSFRAALWWSASLGAIGAALDKQDGKRDWLALFICNIPPMLQVTSYLWAWIMYLVPGAPPGYERGWFAAAIYLALVGLVWLVAAIPDGEDPK